MADIWLRRIERLGVVTNVLSRVEDSESQAIQKVAAGQETHDRTQSESSAVFEKFRDSIELRDVIGTIAAVLDQEREDVLVLSAGVVGEHGDEFLEDGCPGLLLNRRVLDMRDGLAPNFMLCYTDRHKQMLCERLFCAQSQGCIGTRTPFSSPFAPYFLVASILLFHFPPHPFSYPTMTYVL